jgi:dephospho-CoA kinase
MRIIGITGGIGTGKSTILHILEREYGAYIVEADKLAHRLMEPGQPVFSKIVEHFGGQILDEEGKIHRSKLGNIVFQNEKELMVLNQIVHPAVKKYILNDIEEKKKQNAVAYYVIEAALLIEDGYRSICDELWYIHVEKQERIRRLIQGRGGTKEKWESVISSQSADEFYQKNCDVIVENGENLEITNVTIRELLCKDT